MQALVLVNIQIDFFPGGTMEIPGSQEIIPVVNRLAETFDLVVATKVWHPANHISFAANHPWRRPGQVIRVDDREQPLWPMHCVQDTFGSEFVPELKAQLIREVFLLGTDPDIDTHSGFYDVGRQRSSGLAPYLHEKKVESVYLAGVPLEDTIRNTALDALTEGFMTFLIRDGVRPTPETAAEAHHTTALLHEKGVRFVNAADLLK